MLQTYEATIDEDGNIKLVEPVTLLAGYRVLVTVLEEPAQNISETALLSQAALAIDWEREEEEEAWEFLQRER